MNTTLAQQALDATFEAFGQEADYFRSGVGRYTVRIILVKGDRALSFGETRVQTEGTLYEIRKSEIAAPKAGDGLYIDGVMYTVQGTPRCDDPDSLVWILDTRLP